MTWIRYGQLPSIRGICSDVSYQDFEAEFPLSHVLPEISRLHIPGKGGLQLWPRAKVAKKPEPPVEQEVVPQLGLALPLWQTMLAGGLACVLHRAVLGSMEDFARGSRKVMPVLQKNLWKFSGGFPFGAVCCSLYAAWLQS